MAAPTPTARSTPSGSMLSDGGGATITLALDPNIEFFEIDVTPPGFEGDDPIDVTTSFTTTLRGFAPPDLARMTDVTATVGYDPAVYPAIVAALNRKDAVTVTWGGSGDTLAFYGYLRSFTPGSMVRNERPTATITIVATNVDPATCLEELPVWTAGAGTASNC